MDIEINQDYKNKPVEEWTMWDQHCHDFYVICEDHDSWMETEEGKKYYSILEEDK